MKQLDQDGLNELFDLEIEPPAELPPPQVEQIDDDKYVDRELKQLGVTANQILSTAEMMLQQTPDSEAVAAASSLISSITHLLSEFNKTVLMDKRHKQNNELEIMKIKARRELAELRNQHKVASLGSGNTFVQNNNRVVAFSQEDIVKQLSNIDTENEFLIESHNEDEN